MKRQIRQSVFETNSSSVHSLTMCLKADWDKWMKEEVLMRKGKFLETEKAMQENAEDLRKYANCSEEDIKAYLDGELTLADLNVSRWYVAEYWHTPDEDDAYLEGSDYEGFEKTFTTPSGDEVVAFGYYGENR